MSLFLFAFLLGAAAFGTTAEVQVRGLPEEASREAVARALAEVAEAERLAGAGVAALNAAAGRGPQAVDPRLRTVLARASEICFWSEKTHGPLGRDLYALWDPAAGAPDSGRVEEAVARIACERMSFDPARGTVALEEGSGLDLRGFAEGFAVDRAVEVLRERGAANGMVRIGTTWRGFGEGPDGKGWPVALPPIPGLDEPAGRVFLRDSSLSVALRGDRLYVNQRTGKPAQGVVAAAVSTISALDAQALAAVLTITGPREGQLRLGSLQPRPSVVWFMGTGEGHPLRVEYRWSQVPKR